MEVEQSTLKNLKIGLSQGNVCIFKIEWFFLKKNVNICFFCSPLITDFFGTHARCFGHRDDDVALGGDGVQIATVAFQNFVSEERSYLTLSFSHPK